MLNSRHHDVMSSERYMIQSKRLFSRDVARRQVTWSIDAHRCMKPIAPKKIYLRKSQCQSVIYIKLVDIL